MNVREQWKAWSLYVNQSEHTVHFKSECVFVPATSAAFKSFLSISDVGGPCEVDQLVLEVGSLDYHS